MNDKIKAAVFLSHSSQDKITAETIYKELKKQEIDIWASFRDILPGAEWDKSIEDALANSSYVIIIASQASIGSSYVRAEVEFALDNDKLVIPILIDKVKLPPRWHTLQYIDGSGDIKEATKELAKILPKNLMRQFVELLNDPNAFEQLKKFLYENSYWFNEYLPSATFSRLHIHEILQLPQEILSQLVKDVRLKVAENNYPDYSRPTDKEWDTLFKKYQLELSFRSIWKSTNPTMRTVANIIFWHDIINLLKDIDFFEIYFASEKTGYIWLLCDPYQSPFTKNGELSQHILQKIKIGERIFEAGNKGVYGIHGLTDLNFVLVAGQRKLFDEKAKEARSKLQYNWSQHFSRRLQEMGITWRFATLDLISYDNLFERVKYRE